MRIAWRKMCADVAIGEGAQYCIGECVQCDVGVGMAGEGVAMCNVDSTKCNVVTGAKGMHIQSRTGAHIAECSRLNSFRTCEIFRCGELDVARLAREHAHFHASPFGDCSIVGKIITPLRGGAPMRFKQRGKCESLRRLHQPKRPAIESGFYRASLIDTLDGVRYLRAGIVAPVFAAADCCSISAVVAKGRAASDEDDVGLARFQGF